MIVTVILIVSSVLGTYTKGLVQGLEDLEIRGMSVEHSNYSIIEIVQNTEKSAGDLRRLAVTQTSLRNDQLTLGWCEKLSEG